MPAVERYQTTGGNFDCSRLRRQNSITRSLASIVLRLSLRADACSASFNACTADDHRCFSLRATTTASRARLNASTAASLNTATGATFCGDGSAGGSDVAGGMGHIAHALTPSVIPTKQKRRPHDSTAKFNSKAHSVQNLSRQTSISFDKLAGNRFGVNELRTKTPFPLGDGGRARIMPLLSESET